MFIAIYKNINSGRYLLPWPSCHTCHRWEQSTSHNSPRSAAPPAPPRTPCQSGHGGRRRSSTQSGRDTRSCPGQTRRDPCWHIMHSINLMHSIKQCSVWFTTVLLQCCVGLEVILIFLSVILPSYLFGIYCCMCMPIYLPIHCTYMPIIT